MRDSRSRPAGLFAAALALVALAGAPGAGAQAPQAAAPKAEPAAPRADDRRQMQIEADDGIEWDKDRMTYTARGNVRVVRGDNVLRAPVVVAFYREKEGGKNEVFRVEADGGVRVGVGDDTATGDRAVYNVDAKVFVLTGKHLVYNAQDGRVQARDSLEYYEAERRAIARGNAYVVRDAEWMRADTITAFFEERAVTRPGPDGKPVQKTRNEIVRTESRGNVFINSCDAVAFGDAAVYLPETGQMILTGNVRIGRGDNLIRGGRGEMNTRTNFMRILPTEDGRPSGPQRVTGLLEPGSDSGRPTNIPFDSTGVDPCKDRTKQEPAGAASPAKR